MTKPYPQEATIIINGTTLTPAQSMALRVAVSAFRWYLHDPETTEGMGETGKLYDERLIEVESLIRR